MRAKSCVLFSTRTRSTLNTQLGIQRGTAHASLYSLVRPNVVGFRRKISTLATTEPPVKEPPKTGKGKSDGLSKSRSLTALEAITRFADVKEWRKLGY